jgi:broad specificity phosphatase PhoE
MKLLLIRHGQTVWNSQLRTQGHTDIELDETGRLQSEHLARRLSQHNIDAVYASPLQRAKETAAAIAALHGLAVKEHDLLIERNFGIWEGEPFSSLLEKYPDEIKQWETDPLAFTPPQAEPLSEVVTRCMRFLTEIKNAHQEAQTVIVVGHSVPLRLMIAQLIGLAPQRIHSLRLDNAAYTELRLGKNNSILTVLNDTSHLS